MMRIRTMLVPAAALLAMGAGAQAPQTVDLPDLVTVTGNAEVKSAPDMATIRIGVETQAKTAGEAQKKTSELANKLIAAALKVVPDRKAFQTTDLSLFPEYTQPQGGFRRAEGGGAVSGHEEAPQGPRLIGYHARNVLVIRVDDVSKIGPLVDAMTGAGATNVDSISFGLKDDKPGRLQALRDAVREAREKAQAMAEGLGLRLGSVYSVDEGGRIVRPYEMSGIAMAKMDTPVLPGEVSVGANVTVRFRLVK